MVTVYGCYTCHGAALARRQHPYGPDVHGQVAVGAAQEDAALVEVRLDRGVGVGQELVRVAVIAGQAEGVDVLSCRRRRRPRRR